MTSFHIPSPPTPPHAPRPLSAPPRIYPSARPSNYPGLPYPPPPHAYDTDESSNFGANACVWSNSGDSEDSIFLPDNEFMMVNAMRTFSAWEEGTGFDTTECLIPKIVVEDMDAESGEERVMGGEGKSEGGKKGKKARKKEMNEMKRLKLKRAKPLDFGNGEFLVFASGVEDREAGEEHVEENVHEGLKKGKKKKKAEKKKAKLEQKKKEKENEKEKGKRKEKKRRQNFEEENAEKTNLEFGNQEYLLINLEEGSEETPAAERWKENVEAPAEVKDQETKPEEEKQKKKAAKKAKTKEKKEKKKKLKLNFDDPECLLVDLSGEDVVAHESVSVAMMKDARKAIKKKNSPGPRF